MRCIGKGGRLNVRRWSAGCTLLIGVANGVVYFAHVRLGDTRTPSTNPDTTWQNARDTLAAGLATGATFDGVTIPRFWIITLGGRAVNEVTSPL